MLVFFIPAAVLPFQQEQLIAVFHTFCGSGSGKKVFITRQGIHEFSSHVCPASAADSFLQLVVGVISVADHISAVISKESCRMVAVSCGLVVKENVALSVHLAAAVYPHSRIRFRFLSGFMQDLHHSFIRVDYV